jgi:protein-histidine pros-kinase
MARLAAASTRLAAALAQKAPPPRLDEDSGTVEVREAARVFNRMAAQLDEQLRSRELLMAALSHDLRTPLTHLRLRLEGLAHLPEAARCIGSVQQMDALIDSSLAAFREAGQVEAERRTDVLALVQAMADDLAEQGHAVSVRGEALVAAVQPVALTRLLQNLAVNAVRYGGRADIEVRTQGDTIEITVDDDGPGIPPEQLEAVFQPFYRVESSRSRETGGSGLGLGIARDLVTRQGGTLTLANRAAGGLRATVRLPLR